jgi:hypothetical protein
MKLPRWLAVLLAVLALVGCAPVPAGLGQPQTHPIRKRTTEIRTNMAAAMVEEAAVACSRQVFRGQSIC